MDLENPDDFTRLSTLVKGFSNDTRLALLIGFYHGYTAKEITDFLEMTRGGVQNNINKMISADLVYRPAADDAPTYKLTPIGDFFARIFDARGENLLETIDLLAQKEAELEQDLEDTPLANGLDQTAEDKLIHTNKWTEATAEVSDHLPQPRLGIGLGIGRSQTQQPSLSNRIVNTIAEREGIDVSDLPPLYVTLDPEQLDNLFRSTDDDQSVTPGAVTFEYVGYTVTVYSDGSVNLSPPGEDVDYAPDEPEG